MQRLSGTERKICEQVWQWKALSLRDIIWMLPTQSERTVYSLIDRLHHKGVVIKRRILRVSGKEHNAHYIVLSTAGLEMLQRYGAPTSDYKLLRAETAERILLSNQFVFSLMKAGLPLDRVIFREDMLKVLGLPSRLTAVDWGLQAVDGIHVVHFLDRNSRLIWKTMHELRWADGVLGHIVVCNDAAAAARFRRAYYRFPNRRPLMRPVLIVSLTSRDNFRLLAEKMLEPDAWLTKIEQRLQSIDKIRSHGVRCGHGWEMDVLKGRIWIGSKRSWLAADLRIPEMIALIQVRYGWTPRTYNGEQDAEGVVVLVKSYRDAKLWARLAAFSPSFVWVVETPKDGKTVFCSNDGCLVPADSRDARGVAWQW